MIDGLRLLRQRAFGSMFGGCLPPVDDTVKTLRPLPWEIGGKGGPSRAFWERLGRSASRNWLSQAACMATSRPADTIETVSLEAGEARARPFSRLTVRTAFAGRENGDLLLAHEIKSGRGETVGRARSRVRARQDAALDVFPPYRPTPAV